MSLGHILNIFFETILSISNLLLQFRTVKLNENSKTKPTRTFHSNRTDVNPQTVLDFKKRIS